MLVLNMKSSFLDLNTHTWVIYQCLFHKIGNIHSMHFILQHSIIDNDMMDTLFAMTSIQINDVENEYEDAESVFIQSDTTL